LRKALQKGLPPKAYIALSLAIHAGIQSTAKNGSRNMGEHCLYFLKTFLMKGILFLPAET
jgi:hypothetical protein